MAQPTMQQVAERAGVSLALVSLVMRDAPNVSDYRRQLVLDAAEQLGYRPNVLARNLASRRTNTIGVVVNDLHNPFFAEIIDGIQAASDEAGYRILIGNGKHSQRGEAEMIETFLQLRVDGIITAGATMPMAAIEAAATSTEIVLVGRTSRSRVVDSVNTDDVTGARLAVDHLVALGHRRIAHIDGGTGAGSDARRRGYSKAMTDHGLSDEIVIGGGDFSETGGYHAASELLEQARPPTAIFAANDLSAAGVLDRVEDAGFDVPNSMSIVGYDNTALAAMQHMSLTTINQPRDEIGRLAVKFLLERFKEGRTESVHHVIAPTLVTRRTSSRQAAGASA
jgi:DNA-binding LacI/PurR family transcriptional regulator